MGYWMKFDCSIVGLWVTGSCKAKSSQAKISVALDTPISC